MKTEKLAKELIGFETITPVDNPEIFEFLRMYLEDKGIESEIHDVNGVKNLTAEIGHGGASICLNGHVDVVPPGKGWEATDPFVPAVRDGKLYGRGAADMKTGTAALINAFVDLNQDPDFDGSATLMIVGDEEIGGENGSEALVEKYYGNGEGFDYAVVGEPTDLDIQVGTRGAAWFNVYLQGEEFHASRSGMAYNVLNDVPEVIDALNNIELENGHSDLPEPSLEVTTIETNETYNSIPSWVKVGVDVRYLPSQTIEGIKQRISEALDQTPVEYRVELEIDHGGAYTLNDQRFRDIATEAVEKIREETPGHITEGGGSDGRFFANKGTPFIELGVNQEPAHAEDEYCQVENLEKLRRMYYTISRELARADPDIDNSAKTVDGSVEKKQV